MSTTNVGVRCTYVSTLPLYVMLRRTLATSLGGRGVIRTIADAVDGRDGGSGNAGRISISLRMIPCERMNSLVALSQSVKWYTIPKIFRSMPMFKSFHEMKSPLVLLGMRERRTIRPCGKPQFCEQKIIMRITFD